jgi:DNA polymerase III delta prime subunit
VNTAEKNSKKAESEYKSSVEKQNKTRDHYFLALGGLMSVMEALDKKRIDILKKNLSNYSVLQSTFLESLETGVKVLEASFEAINAEEDVQEFILKTKSDKKRPPIEVFEPMSCKIQKGIFSILC